MMDGHNPKAAPTESSETSLKEILLIIQDYYQEVIKHWKLIFILIIPCVILFIFQAVTTKSTFAGKLTFMVNEDEGGSMGGAMAILSQFGFGGGGGGNYNLDKVMELSKARKIIYQTLFERITVDGNEDYIANHIIDLYELHDQWEESDHLRMFTFEHGKIQDFTRVENSALKSILGVVIGNQNIIGFYSSVLDKDTGIMSLKANSRAEALTIQWLNLSYENLGQYYINKSTEKQQATFRVVNQKADSLLNALNTKEYQLAQFKDSNRGLWTAKDRLREKRLSRDIQMLTLMYGEAVKNKEIAEFSLKSKTPFIQLIDPPMEPLAPTKQSKVIAIIKGILLGTFLALTFILGRKIIRDTLNTPE